MEKIMRFKLFVATLGICFTAAPTVFAASMDEMAMDAKPSSPATQAAYRFELAGPAKSAGSGKSIVIIRLVHDGKPVRSAIIVQSRADMSPIGMAGMTAPIKPLGEQPPGAYRFEVDNGAVWKKPDNWSLSFSAKVQGVEQTVTGSVIVKLSP
jgi:hypothetical protein